MREKFVLAVFSVFVLSVLAFAGLSDTPDPTGKVMKAVYQTAQASNIQAGTAEVFHHLDGTTPITLVKPKEGWDDELWFLASENSCSSNANCLNALNALCGTKGDSCKAVEPVYTEVQADGDTMCANNDGCTGGGQGSACNRSVPFVICSDTPLSMSNGGW